MRAIVLAGGYGKRLAPLTERIPKALVPVAGETVLGHLLTQAAKTGVTHVVFSLNQNQKSVENHFGTRAFGMELSYHYEKSQSDLDKPGAIGALYQVAKEHGSEESFLLGGDNTVFGLDFGKMLAFHRTKKAPATLALYQLENLDLVPLYGVAQTDVHGRIVQFQEKPKVGHACSTLASTAVYALSERFFSEHLREYVEKNRGKKDRIGDLWDYFVDKIPLYGFSFSGVWGDTNSPESYVDIHRKVMQLDPARFDVSKTATLSSAAKIIPPVIIGDSCHVEEGAVVGPETHLSSGCRIGKDARVVSSILFQNVTVGPQSQILQSVIDKDAQLQKGARIDPSCLIGQGARIGSRAHLSRGVRIGSEKSVRPDVLVQRDVF